MVNFSGEQKKNIHFRGGDEGPRSAYLTMLLVPFVRVVYKGNELCVIKGLHFLFFYMKNRSLYYR